jgi:predicted aconitase with swiveling domain
LMLSPKQASSVSELTKKMNKASIEAKAIVHSVGRLSFWGGVETGGNRQAEVGLE